MGVPAARPLKSRGFPTGEALRRRIAGASISLCLVLPALASAELPARPATKPAAGPSGTAPNVVLPFPGLAAASTAAKPKPVRHRRHAAPRRVVQAAPPPPPPPPPARQVVDNQQVNLAELPASARQALLDLHDRMTAGGPCRGISLSAFELGLTPIVATRYNEDARPDFFFHDPCGPRGAGAEGSTLLLLSDPLGYHLSASFAAALGEVDGRPVLLAHVACDPAAGGPGYDCLLARFWDPAHRRWGEIQEIRPDVATGGGPGPAPLAAPAPPPTTPPAAIQASTLPAPHPAE